MDEAAWARHENPWSVWMLNTALPREAKPEYRGWLC